MQSFVEYSWKFRIFKILFLISNNMKISWIACNKENDEKCSLNNNNKKKHQKRKYYLYIFIPEGPPVLLPGESPWTEEPGRLQSMGSLRVGHDWVTSLSLFTFMHWRRKWQPTPVFLPGESQGRGSLVGCRLWGHTESDTTEVT